MELLYVIGLGLMGCVFRDVLQAPPLLQPLVDVNIALNLESKGIYVNKVTYASRMVIVSVYST